MFCFVTVCVFYSPFVSCFLQSVRKLCALCCTWSFLLEQYTLFFSRSFEGSSPLSSFAPNSFMWAVCSAKLLLLHAWSVWSSALHTVLSGCMLHMSHSCWFGYCCSKGSMHLWLAGYRQIPPFGVVPFCTSPAVYRSVYFSWALPTVSVIRSFTHHEARNSILM